MKKTGSYMTTLYFWQQRNVKFYSLHHKGLYIKFIARAESLWYGYFMGIADLTTSEFCSPIIVMAQFVGSCN